jgi:hypothetical protein
MGEEEKLEPSAQVRGLNNHFVMRKTAKLFPKFFIFFKKFLGGNVRVIGVKAGRLRRAREMTG